MRLFFTGFAIAGLISLSGCKYAPSYSQAQANGPVSATDSQPGNSLPADHTEQAFVYGLKGKIGNSDISMFLTALPPSKLRGALNKSTVSGTYYYDRYGQLISLSGHYNETNDSIELHYYAPNGGMDEAFFGTLKKGSFSGKWRSSKKVIPFELAVIPSLSHGLVVQTLEDSLTGVNHNQEKVGAYAFVQWLEAHPGSDPGAARFLNQSLAKLITGSEEPVRTSKKRIADTRELFKEFKEHVLEDSAYGVPVNFYDEIRLEILASTERLLGVRYTHYSFAGGAHGNYFATLVSYDPGRKKKIDYSDLFKPGFEPDLLSALEKRVRDHFEISLGSPLSQVLLVDQLELPETFALTPKGIYFHYSPYEIAAYAYGESEFFVPFSELKTHLRTNTPYFPSDL